MLAPRATMTRGFTMLISSLRIGSEVAISSGDGGRLLVVWFLVAGRNLQMLLR